MTDHKPLPALPVPAALSIDARRHRARLIHQFLSGTTEIGVQSRKEGWVYVLEEVLDELGRSLHQGKWLEGVRRWREQQRDTRKQALSRQETVKAKKSEKIVEGEGDAAASQSEQGSLNSSKELPSKPVVTPKAGAKHLLLCVAPPGSRNPLPSEDSGFDIVPANIGCTFLPGTYALQHGDTRTVLFGAGDASAAQTIGGTFQFKGLTSVSQHEHLFCVLRLAIYVHLALTLEQHLLMDSGIVLSFPRPKLPASSPSAPGHSSKPPPTTEQTRKKWLFSFFSPSKVSLGRSTTILPVGHDLSIPSVPSTPIDFGSSFRFSLLGTRAAAPSDAAATTPFAHALEQLEASVGLLSTSPGVHFAPPPPIADLGAREKQNGVRVKVRGDERAALSSILGWEGREQAGRGMVGTTGFVRQQGIEVLVSHHVPKEGEGGGLTGCGRAEWKTYQYFGDRSLGETVEDLVEGAKKACEVVGCKHAHGLHETRMFHGGVKITIQVEEEQHPTEGTIIELWESCTMCGAQSAQRELSDGTYLLSYGKFIELLIYSSSLGPPRPTICEHADRFDIRRHFGTRTHKVSFRCSRVEDIYELRVPRLQITRGERCVRESTTSTEGSAEENDEEREKRELRKEITKWWAGVADHMDKLEAVFVDDEETDFAEQKKWKTLPRLPSADEDYANLDSHITPTFTKTETSAPGLPSIRSTPPRSTSSLLTNTSSVDTPPRAPAPPPSPATTTPIPPSEPPDEAEIPQPVIRLSSLRQTFHRTEQSLYAQLSRTRGGELNEVRRSFVASAKGAEKRLCAWQKKHLVRDKDGKNVTEAGENLEWAGGEEPEWWITSCHVLPGSNIIVKEDDWGSVIAFTLSTPDYQRELTRMSIPRQASVASALPQTPSIDNSPTISNHSNPSSFFSAAMHYKLFTASTHVQPDPDLDDVTWSEPELFSTVISRKEHPRDATNSLLSIREVLRQGQKSPAPDPSRFGSLGRGPAPPLAWAKPDVQLSKDEADGMVSREASDVLGKASQDTESATGTSSHPPAPLSRASESLISLAIVNQRPLVESTLSRSKAPSVASVESDGTIGKEGVKELSGSTIRMPPPLPPKDEWHAPRDLERPRDFSNATVTTTTTNTSSFTSTLTSGLNNALRFMRHGGPGSVDASRAASPFVKAHHGLLSLDAAAIDERPHIKYDWTIGKRLKFSCTVYYAKQFDLLRRRCGVDDIFVKSLRRSANWAADGGKSRSNFWKTSDERFIIKTLVDAWNVADLQVLIDLAPSYFRYMDFTSNKATVLAKMMGFYTIEIRNLETGAVQSKADLLVMENLFYNQRVGKTFDLKGIQGRKVKPSNAPRAPQRSQTLFDGDWIEGQQKALMLLRPHSKHVLRTAIKTDAEFLAKIGINEEQKEIACGLVDTIGSYTFAKTLEYKAKQGLNSGKDITVVPPAEYQERFVSALEGYFVACPDKWSKPMDESKIISDPMLLPSVL
ncbi:hypothetical protein H0H81_006675 [Sphagnurus paluster]|uniref:PIPK domain-containing protein n=1 Tax=Sphagnurus paluster TaxID=117069 RepID=A0A9P7GNY5_9AGAR|nr:hypothetical protein H0H81_006675 [Sphagnurus paluster]